MTVKKVTTKELMEMKLRGEKIAMLTAYDYLMATQMDECGIDVILVGDSVANVLLGYKSTIPVTMEEMIHHCKAVSRGVKRAMVVGDMPFMSYQASVEEAVRNAGRFLKEAGAAKIIHPIPRYNKVETNLNFPAKKYLKIVPANASPHKTESIILASASLA